MSIDINERTDNIKRNNRRRLNLDEIQAVLGRSDTGAIANSRMPGRVWVSIYASNGLLGFRSALAPTKYFRLNPNIPVKLKYDVRGRLQIDEPDADTQLTTGVDPVAMSTLQDSNSTTQSDFETLRVTATDTPSLIVCIKAWKVFTGGILYIFPGANDVDLEPFLPASGEMCYALIALQSDYSTIEITTSTPRSVDDIALNVDDEQECAAALSANATPIWCIKLVGDQAEITQSDIDLDGQDERQMVNSVASMGVGDVSGPASATAGRVALFDGASGKLLKDNGDALLDGNLKLETVGDGLYVKEGSNATMGTGTLSAGTATVNTTKVTANSRVFLTDTGGGVLGNIGSLYVGTVTAGTSFVVNSTNVLDSSNFNWLIMEPA